jgi:hypothetical protein
MQFDVSLKGKEVYERGATLLTVLAYPNERDAERRLQLYLSLCGRALWLRHVIEPDDWMPITVRPQYVFRDRKIIDRHVAFAGRRMQERLVAGRMAVLFFRRAEIGALPPLPDGIKRLSINQMAAFVLDDAGQADLENVEKRFWRPSKPVIHLATAAALVGQELQKADVPLLLDSFLFHEALIEAVLRRAELLKELISKDPKFPAKAEQLIQLPFE